MQPSLKVESIDLAESSSSSLCLNVETSIEVSTDQIPSSEHSMAQGNSLKETRVAGFDFPLTCEEDIDRLELMVRRNPLIRNQYIRYLSANKPPNMDVGQVFYRFFENDSLSNFNWSGIERGATATGVKKAMQQYEIFNACMLEAWQSHDVTMASLKERLKRALLLISRRRYTNEYNKRRQIQRMTQEK
ncbi:uncharacterized protein LOC129763350 [Toxorhynchites rutilus septentrionalis]|uniref:uncharacterized protein LOC129763350 n=1 Tax=Toxorhynchites rutilus septentrionalis TaxID=329112 RepID=UPI0024796112|nr:uncharacterized protein LOC129763350 [Toxorhynchites rutilus septentrionalis]